MIVRSTDRTARTVLSVGALMFAAIIFGFPMSAKAARSTSYRWCVSRCNMGDFYCFYVCDISFPKKKASISPARRPTTGSGAPTRPTHLHR